VTALATAVKTLAVAAFSSEFVFRDDQHDGTAQKLTALFCSPNRLHCGRLWSAWRQSDGAL